MKKMKRASTDATKTNFGLILNSVFTYSGINILQLMVTPILVLFMNLLFSCINNADQKHIARSKIAVPGVFSEHMPVYFFLFYKHPYPEKVSIFLR